MCKAEELQHQLSKIEYCSITIDIWTSQATMGYATITCHFLTDDWELKSVVLETTQIEESHTAENIGATLVAITDKWHITQKVYCVITDNANNIVAAVRHNKWNHLPTTLYRQKKTTIECGFEFVKSEFG